MAIILARLAGSRPERGFLQILVSPGSKGLGQRSAGGHREGGNAAGFRGNG